MKIPIRVLLAALALVNGMPAQNTSSSPVWPGRRFQDPTLGVEDRITDLLAAMTLDEKIATLGN